MDPHHTPAAESCLAVLLFIRSFVQGNDVSPLGVPASGKEFSVVVIDRVVDFRCGERPGESHIPVGIRGYKPAVVGQLTGFIWNHRSVQEIRVAAAFRHCSKGSCLPGEFCLCGIGFCNVVALPIGHSCLGGCCGIQLFPDGCHDGGGKIRVIPQGIRQFFQGIERSLRATHQFGNLLFYIGHIDNLCTLRIFCRSRNCWGSRKNGAVHIRFHFQVDLHLGQFFCRTVGTLFRQGSLGCRFLLRGLRFSRTATRSLSTGICRFGTGCGFCRFLGRNRGPALGRLGSGNSVRFPLTFCPGSGRFRPGLGGTGSGDAIRIGGAFRPLLGYLTPGLTGAGPGAGRGTVAFRPGFCHVLAV